MVQKVKDRPKAKLPQPESGRLESEPLWGCEVPTIFTPPLRELTPETSHGFEAIAFAEQVLGLKLYPWQKWLLIHALELLPNGKYRFRTVLVLVARQNGKSRVLQVLSLWRLYVDGAPLVIGTAQNLDIAEEQWGMAVELAQENDDLAEEIAHVNRTNGKYALKLAPNVEFEFPERRYKVAAANRKGGRGLSGDLILMDELREHSNWESWSAVTKTTMARKKPQVWAASNAGDASSVVLRSLRQTCLQALKEGTTETQRMGLFEWSAVFWNPKGGDAKDGAWENLKTSDRQGWAQANPSLNHGDLTLDALEAAWGTDPDPVFRTECLCQWISTASAGPWEDGLWEGLKDKKSKRAKDTPYWFGVDVSWDRNWAAITVAGYREDGLIHVEVVAYRTGTEWVVPWLKERRARPGLLGVVLQANGSPVSALLNDMQKEFKADEKAGIPELPILEWGGGELGRGTGQFYDLVRQRKIRHRGQDSLTLAASTAQSKPISDYWLWDRKRSPFDCSPLIACNAAVWALTLPVEEEKASAYDDDEMIFV